jgi:hypothetical protein
LLRALTPVSPSRVYFRTAVERQLEKLAIEIEKAGKERKALQRFLTSNAENDSIASHDKILDKLISELTVSMLGFFPPKFRHTLLHSPSYAWIQL